jgi:hypothetical protein
LLLSRAHAVAVQALRLCPCSAAEPLTSSIHDAVAAVVAQQLKSGETNAFVGRQYDVSKGHASICQGPHCPSYAALKTFDLSTLGFPSNLELLQSLKFEPGQTRIAISSHLGTGTIVSGFRLRLPVPAATFTAFRKC